MLETETGTDTEWESLIRMLLRLMWMSGVSEWVSPNHHHHIGGAHCTHTHKYFVPVCVCVSVSISCCYIIQTQHWGDIGAHIDVSRTFYEYYSRCKYLKKIYIYIRSKLFSFFAVVVAASFVVPTIVPSIHTVYTDYTSTGIAFIQFCIHVLARPRPGPLANCASRR